MLSIAAPPGYRARGVLLPCRMPPPPRRRGSSQDAGFLLRSCRREQRVATARQQQRNGASSVRARVERGHGACRWSTAATAAVWPTQSPWHGDADEQCAEQPGPRCHTRSSTSSRGGRSGERPCTTGVTSSSDGGRPSGTTPPYVQQIGLRRDNVGEDPAVWVITPLRSRRRKSRAPESCAFAARKRQLVPVPVSRSQHRCYDRSRHMTGVLTLSVYSRDALRAL